MKLYLMQHGKYADVTIDPEEGLSKEGAIEIEKSAHILKKMGISFDKVISSPKKRALQTAQIMVNSFNFSGEIVETEKVKPMAEPEIFVEEFLVDESIYFIASHLPFITKLAGLLMGCSEIELNITNGGCLALEMVDPFSYKAKLMSLITREQFLKL